MNDDAQMQNPAADDMMSDAPMDETVTPASEGEESIAPEAMEESVPAAEEGSAE